MKIKQIFFIVALLVIMSLVGGCQLPAPQAVTSTPLPVAIYTAAAQTIVAQLTEAALLVTSTPPVFPTAEVPSPTSSPQPTIQQTAALAPATETPAPTPTISPQAPAQPGLIFEDNFETDKGWVNLVENDFSMGYANGAYRIFVNLITTTSPVFSIRSQTLADARVEVDAVKAAGPEDSFYGVICRFKDKDNYYSFVISPDGFYRIAKKVDGKFSNLISNTQSGMIEPGNAVNRIRADCVGNNLTLSVNGQMLLEVQDDGLHEGDIGLVAGTRTQEGADVLFDNLAIYMP